ncbi:MAG: hypothetical protein U1E16_04580 [Hyphomicrobiales bacterium]
MRVTRKGEGGADIVVTARDLTRYSRRSGAFSGHATLKALDGASFTIERGKTLAVVGPVGTAASPPSRVSSP